MYILFCTYVPWYSSQHSHPRHSHEGRHGSTVTSRASSSERRTIQASIVAIYKRFGVRKTPSNDAFVEGLLRHKYAQHEFELLCKVRSKCASCASSRTHQTHNRISELILRVSVN